MKQVVFQFSKRGWREKKKKKQTQKRNIICNKVVNLVQVYNFLGCCVAISVSFVQKLKKIKNSYIQNLFHFSCTFSFSSRQKSIFDCIFLLWETLDRKENVKLFISSGKALAKFYRKSVFKRLSGKKWRKRKKLLERSEENENKHWIIKEFSLFFIVYSESMYKSDLFVNM